HLQTDEGLGPEVVKPGLGPDPNGRSGEDQLHPRCRPRGDLPQVVDVGTCENRLDLVEYHARYALELAILKQPQQAPWRPDDELRTLLHAGALFASVSPISGARDLQIGSITLGYAG